MGIGDWCYELRFSPITSEAVTSSHQFKLSALKTPVVMDGYVMPSDDPERTMGMVLFNRPDGDVTGDDLDACTVWQGFKRCRWVDPQSGDSPAAEKIVFPGSVRIRQLRSAWGDARLRSRPGMSSISKDAHND